MPVLKRTRTKRSRRRVRALLIAPTGEVLLVKNWFGPQNWTFPGGGIAKGETPKTALVRELKEELGLTVKPERLRFIGEITEEETRFRLLCYVIRLESKALPLVSSVEIIDTKWHKIHASELEKGESTGRSKGYSDATSARKEMCEMGVVSKSDP